MSAQILQPAGWLKRGKPDEVKRSAPWVEAVEKFVAAEFKPGEAIPHAWFFTAFGIVEPRMCGSFNDSRQAQFQYLTNMEALKTTLLEEHQIALRNVRGVGYAVVPPGEQTEWAMDEARCGIGKALRAAIARASFVQMDALTEAQRKENLDARAKLSFFRKETRKALT